MGQPIVTAHTYTKHNVLPMQVAAEQSAGNGKCNLRRLKKQFKALKSTFTVYDMKEGFIDGELLCVQVAL